MICTKCNREFPILKINPPWNILSCGHIMRSLLEVVKDDSIVARENLPIEIGYCVRCETERAIRSKTTTLTAIIRRFQCGHETAEVAMISAPSIEKTQTTEKPEKPISLTPVPSKPIHPERDEKWSLLFPYQQRGVEFAEDANFCFLNADEMGLGKTIQTIMALRYNEQLLPALVIVPAGLVYQWQSEFKKWFNDRHKSGQFAPLIHKNSDGNLLEGMNIHIISNSLIAKPAMLEAILAYRFKTVIADESHSFKNDNSSRTLAFQKICEVIPHKMLLSGTSVMNRTAEYFNTLHAVCPAQWPNKNWLLSYCTYDRRGRALGLANHSREKFFNRTSKYIIRRKKEDVLPDLPEKMVNYEFINLTDNKQFVNSYNKQLDRLEDLIATKSSGQPIQIIAIMSQLRHIVGLAKVRHLMERVHEFVSTTGEKLCIGTHHKMVMSSLADLCHYRICPECKNINFDTEAPYCEFCSKDWNGSEVHIPITMSDEDALVKDTRSNLFKDNDTKKLLIASILGCGIGRNLQFCHNVIIGERQWNRATEAQFEDRFHRIGTTEKVRITYVSASETIDEFYDAMVKLKEQISGSTLDTNFESDDQFMKELAEKMVAKRLRYVG